MSVADRFNQTAFSRFINGGNGRIFRLAAGACFAGAGVILLPSPLGVGLLAWSVLPLSAGLFDVCWISAVLGGPLAGTRIRECQTRG